MELKHLIYLSAIGVLLIGGISSAYVYTTTTDSDTITIQDEEYTIDQIIFITQKRTFIRDSTEYTGAALDDLILKAGIANPEDHQYTLIAADYQQTVEWDDLKTGVLTEEQTSIFSELPKKFWVKNIIEIEVS